MSGRNAAKNPNTRPTEMKAISAAKQLLSRHHGRKDHVTETSLNAGQVDAQTQSPKMSAAATSPEIKPTTKPFLKFGYIASIRLTKKAEPPPTRDVNRDSGSDSANGGWLRRLVRHQPLPKTNNNVTTEIHRRKTRRKLPQICRQKAHRKSIAQKSAALKPLLPKPRLPTKSKIKTRDAVMPNEKS